MKTLIQIITLGILSLSFLGQTQASDRGRIQASSGESANEESRNEKLFPKEKFDFRKEMLAHFEMVKEGFEESVEDPVELEKIYRSIRKSKESVYQIETLGDLQDAYKELSKYLALLAELGSQEEDLDEEDLMMLQVIALMSKGFLDLARAASFEEMEDSFRSKLGGQLMVLFLGGEESLRETNLELGQEEMPEDLKQDLEKVLKPVWERIKKGFKALEKDRRERRETFKSLDQLRKSVREVGTFDDAVKVFKSLEGYFVTLVELESTNRSQSPEQKGTYFRLRSFFEFHGRGPLFLIGGLVTEEDEDMIEEFLGMSLLLAPSLSMILKGRH